MIIVFEGIDGCGKSTQLARLKKCLEEMGKDVVVYKFPTHQSTKYGQYIDEYLKGELGKLEDVPVEIPTLLFASDKYNIMKGKETQDRIKNGKFLLMDRYYYSSAAHQGGTYKGENKEEFVKWILGVNSRLPKEDVVFLFDISAEKAQEMIAKKHEAGEDRKYLEGKKDILEEDKGHLNDTRNIFLKLAEERKWIVIKVLDENGEIRNIEDIHNEVWDRILPFIQ